MEEYYDFCITNYRNHNDVKVNMIFFVWIIIIWFGLGLFKVTIFTVFFVISSCLEYNGLSFSRFFYIIKSVYDAKGMIIANILSGPIPIVSIM